MTTIALYRKYLGRLRDLVENGEVTDNYMSPFALGFFICVCQTHSTEIGVRLWSIALSKWTRVRWEALERLQYL